MKKDFGPYSMSGKLMRVPTTPQCCGGCVLETRSRCDIRRCTVDGKEEVDYILIDPADRQLYELTAVKYKLTEDLREWEPFIHRQSLKGRST